MEKKRLFAAVLTAAVFFCSFGCGKSGNVQVFDAGEKTESETVFMAGTEQAGDESRKDGGKDTPQVQTETAGSIYVYVCGAVENPGVVEVPAGARVFEAIEKAGGMTADAADFAVNQASILEDGQQITVPTLEEAAGWTAEESVRDFGSGEADSEKKVNINQAAAEELMTLPGIGETKAAGIIEYRESAGGFQSIEEIKNVSGIGEAVFMRIKDRIVI